MSYNIYVAKHANNLNIWGWHFENYWTFTLAAVLLATPLLTAANYLFAVGFHVAYKSFNQVWLIFLLFIVAQILASLVTTFLLLHEIPSKGNLVGFTMAIIGLFIANVWK